MLTLALVSLLLFAGYVRAGSSTNASLSERGKGGAGSIPFASRSESDEVAYWHDLAVKRLKGWHRAEVARDDARARLRNVLKRRGTGIPWLDSALCIHHFESVNWFLDGHHDGGMQFNPGTWRAAGGRGYAFQAAPIEQLYRAFVIWRMDGGSWREWSTHGLCGV